MASIEDTYRKATALRKRSRQLLAFALLTTALSCEQAQAQTFSEWFRQNSTQRNYLLQQISALMTYRQYARNGYQIAKGGLGSIGSSIGKEFGLHGGYYQQLKMAGPVVRQDPQVKMALRRQRDILTKVQKIRKQDGLTPAEAAYVKRVCKTLLIDCDGQLHDLDMVLGDSKAEMADEERLRQIARLSANMQDNYRFAATFSEQLKSFVLRREQMNKDIQITRKYYEKAP